MSVCEQRDQDDCLEWSEPVPCPSELPECSLGKCMVQFGNPGVEVAALDPPQCQEHAVAEDADAVHTHDVRMIDPREGSCLAEHPGVRRVGGLAIGAQELERHPAVEVRVVGGVDDPVIAAPLLVQNRVPFDPLAGRDGNLLRGGRRRKYLVLQRARTPRPARRVSYTA